MGKDDMIDRDNKTPNLPGSATFIGLRAADIYLQYQLLTGAASAPILSFFGSSALLQTSFSQTGYALLNDLRLSPYRLALLGMAVGASAKHIFWKLFIGQENFSVGAAAAVGAGNSIGNGINNLLFVCAATSLASGRGESPSSSDWPAIPLAVGSTLFVTGILTETISEVQRALFKRQPENAGKPYTGGLFGLARHINYGGYTLWRTGFALAGGGWIWGVATAAVTSWAFVTKSIPELDSYCETRYADMWHDYREGVRWQLLPFIY